MIGTAHTMAAILAISAFTVLSTSQANALDEKSQVAAAVSIPFDELTESFEGYKCFARPNKDAQMGFSNPNRVTEVLVKSGQRVKKGEILIRGDDEEDLIALELQKVRSKSKSTVDRARAQAELAKLENDKIKLVAQKGDAASPQELDRARLSYEAAKADFETAEVEQRQQEIAVERLQSRVDRARIIAPFDGVVDFVKVDAGQQTNENDKILRVVNVSPLWIDVPALTPETVMLGTKLGDEAWVLMDVAGKPRVMKAKVIEMAPTGDASSRTRQVRLELVNPDRADGSPGELVAGEPAWVRFSAPSEEWNVKLQGAMAMTTGAAK